MQTKIMEGGFVHTVLFWLKNPNDEKDRATFEASIKKFVHQSGFATQIHVGVPASTNRPVIDASYTYCLTVTFPSKAEHDAYQVEPAHKTFIAESADLWKKVLIYDSVNIL